MKSRSPFLITLAVLLSLTILVPPEVPAQGTQRAGQISRAIPEVAIARGAQNMPALVKTMVDWGDAVRTGDGGRARVALDDGSVLNVGSSSTLMVTQHNAASQQTQIELTYGRVRSQVIKQSKPNAKFEIHTAVGVAGVVGTDFFLGYMNDLFQIIVFEGHVKFCNLDGICVDVLAGQIATIRDGHQPPDQPDESHSFRTDRSGGSDKRGIVLHGEPSSPSFHRRADYCHYRGCSHSGRGRTDRHARQPSCAGGVQEFGHSLLGKTSITILVCIEVLLFQGFRHSFSHPKSHFRASNRWCPRGDAQPFSRIQLIFGLPARQWRPKSRRNTSQRAR